MPTYEFRCSNGHAFDQIHKMSESPSTAICPICGAVAERAISGGAGLVFKGSGFYLTDYGKNAHRTSGSGPAAKSGGDSGEGSGKSSGSKESASKDPSGTSGGSGSSSSSSGGEGGGSGSSSASSTASGGGGSTGSTGNGGSASGGTGGTSGGAA